MSSSRIALAWTDNSTNELWFTIERSTDGVTFGLAAIASANQVTYSNTSLTANTTYTYRVRAYDGSAYTAYTNTASATTLGPPNAPSELRATATSKGRIVLRWTDDATNEGGFKLERSTDGVNFTQIALLPANSTAYSNGGLSSGHAYHYRVRAYDGPNHSEYSNIASATAK